MAWLVLIILILASLAGGAAIAYVTGAAAVLSFVLADSGRYLAILPQRILSQVDVFTFLSMPLFILTGELMNRGGVTRALIDLAMVLVGRMKGGLGHVNVLTNAMMGGVSGSAVADASMQSRLFGTAMIERGYSRGTYAAVIAFSSIITATIPPSIGLILFGLIATLALGQWLVQAQFVQPVLAFAQYLRDGARGEPVEPPELPRIWKPWISILRATFKRSSESLARLRSSEDRYRRLVELSPDAVMLHDAEGITFVSDQTPRLVAYDRDGNIVGRCRGAINGAHGLYGDRNGNLFMSELPPAGLTRLARID